MIILFLCMHAVQKGGGQWVMGRVVEALEDKTKYQQILLDGNFIASRKSVKDQLREVRKVTSNTDTTELHLPAIDDRPPATHYRK